MPSVQSLTLTYDALNENRTFSEGDTLTGKVTLALFKETAVGSFFVKVKGDADVCWTKRSGDRTYMYSESKRYFKRKQFFIQEGAKGHSYLKDIESKQLDLVICLGRRFTSHPRGFISSCSQLDQSQPGQMRTRTDEVSWMRDNVLPQGVHVYSFTFTLPQTNMPSSYKGSHGNIVYKLEAKLSRSWKFDRTAKVDIQFVSKSIPNPHYLMSQQIGSTRKEMGLFSSGFAYMEVIVDKKAYAPGETITIVAKINNSTSKEMIPKFHLIQEVVYRAKGSTKYESDVILRAADHSIKSQTQKDVRCTMKIPRHLTPSLQNCDLISVEYHLKTYLDISFAFDPEVKFPVVIIPAELAPVPRHGVAAGPNPAGAVGGPSNSDFPPPAASRGPYPASPHSGSYGYPGAQRYSASAPVYPGNPQVYADPPGVYPAQPAHMSGGYSNPVPQRASPYGSPFSSSSSSPVLHPPPTAPTFQPPISAPEIQPSPPPPPFNISPAAPTYNLLPSAPAMNTDFLSQSDEAPPAYSLLFPSAATDNSDAK